MSDLQPQAAETTPLAPVVGASGDAAPVFAPADDSGSLADHEATHSPEARTADPDETRDEQGRFQKPRRRAASQQADADDVPTINALTKRLRDAEEAVGKDITRKAGESDRVFNLRRRAELIERHAAQPEPKPAAPVAQSQPSPQPRQAQPVMRAFPSYEDFLAINGMAEATYDDYTDARADWRYAIRREQERQQEAAETAQREFHTKATTHQQRVTVAKAQHPDWDTVVTSDLPVTRVINDAVLASAQSGEVQYYLGSHRDELAALNLETQDYSPSAVAAMRRYLDTLVAPVQRSSPPTRTAAGSTGSALALAPPPAPRPPNPVRTGAVTPADDPPGDDNMSLAAHEKHFGRARR